MDNWTLEPDEINNLPVQKVMVGKNRNIEDQSPYAYVRVVINGKPALLEAPF